MVRPRDPEFAPDEPVYRGLRLDDFKGGQVLPASIDVPASSIVRSKHGGRPEDALNLAKRRVRVAGTTAEGFPLRLSTGVPDSKEWIVSLEDCPSEEEGDHHAEIRAVPTDGTWDAEKPQKPRDKMKVMIRDSLAKRLTVLEQPRT